MERKTHIKVVAAALTVVFLASITVAGFASAASSNAAGQGVYLTFAMSHVKSALVECPSGSWVSIVSITVPNVGYAAWWNVVCDGYTYCASGTELAIAIGVNSYTPDTSTYRFYEGGGGPTYSGVHTEEMYYLGAGSHTFYFLGRRYYGTGLCRVAYSKITVTFFTDAYVAQVSGGEVSGSPDLR